ncbi:MAG: MMPL family transporter [Candidatus Methanoplasma sp.]|jgi:RND superfamily putative drug exporter|nr:MMPL family transporter [Candidatus Methanoplasma sp.]
MILEGLAEFIRKHAKMVIVAWILVLICAFPFVSKVSESLEYGTDSMSSPDSESVEGMKIMEEFFGSSGADGDDRFIIAVEFRSPQGYQSALTLYEKINERKDGFVDGNGNKKIDVIAEEGVFTKDGGGSGVVLYAVEYVQSYGGDFVRDDTDNLRGFISDTASDSGLAGIVTYVTGSPAINYDTQKESSKDLSRIDPFTVLLILILVGLFFRSFITSAMPPITIGVAFGVAMMGLYFIGSVMSVSYIAEMFLLVSMMGAGCDYCIFILARYKEERKAGAGHDEALKRSIVWGGESIATSGLSVMIGFGAMSICSFSMISTMGIVLAMGIVFALVAALTLITSILALFGDRLFWPSKIERADNPHKGFYGRMSALSERYFKRSVRTSIKHAKVIIVAAVLFTIPMAYITFTAPSSYDMVSTTSTGDAAHGMQKIEEYGNGGMMMPDYLLMELSSPIATVTFMPSAGQVIPVVAWTEEAKLQTLLKFPEALTDDNIGEVWGIYVWLALAENAAAKNPNTDGKSDHDYAIYVYGKALDGLPAPVRAAMLKDDVIGAVVAQVEAIEGHPVKYDDALVGGVMDGIVNYDGVRSIGGLKGDDGSVAVTYVNFTLITKGEPMSDRSMETIRHVQGQMDSFIDSSGGLVTKTWITGSPAVMFEISEKVSSEFGKVEILAIALIFVLLFLVMKAYLTPLRSILTILMSVAWTIGMTHLLFSDMLGYGVMWIIPIVLLVICLGLGMDYDILLTTRIKENVRHKGMTNDEAITSAVLHSGSVITICGLIMGGAFGTLMLSGTVMFREFGFALAFAILVDALVVRTYIVPAAMHLLGDWNWIGPKFLHRKD